MHVHYSPTHCHRQVLPSLASAMASSVGGAGSARGTSGSAAVLRGAGRLLECALQLLPRVDDGEACLDTLLQPLQVG
jgi:hypothetical protein